MTELALGPHDQLGGITASDLAIGIGVLIAGISYTYAIFDLGHRPQLRRRGLVRAIHPILFGAGLLTIAGALLSPLDQLSDMRFSAHMGQHILLLMVAPPMVLLGLPSPLVRAGLSRAHIQVAVARLTDPLLAFFVFNLNLYIWHVPGPYELALSNELIHDFEHALFFYTGIMFWWRVIDPSRGWFPLWRWPPARWVYLLVAAPPSYVLGTLLWGSGELLYPSYARVSFAFARSALEDQQLGGLIMWVQGWMFLMLSMLIFFRWYDPEREEV